MAKVVDITEKLAFEESPKIKIKGVEIEVKNDAITMLEVMQLVGENPSTQDAIKAFNLIIGADGKEKIRKLNLNVSDFMIIIQEAMSVAMGSSDERGE